MPGLYRLIFQPGGFVRIQRGTRGNYYILDDGSRLEVWRRPVWCCACRAFTEGEVVSEIEEIVSAAGTANPGLVRRRRVEIRRGAPTTDDSGALTSDLRRHHRAEPVREAPSGV